MEENSRYENRLPAEGINVSNEHPLKEFASLLLMGLLIVLSCVAILAYLSAWLAPKVPFEFEVALAERFESQFFGEQEQSEGGDSGKSIAHSAVKSSAETVAEHRELYLQNLLAEHLAAYPLPEGLSIRLHYVDDDTVNAFATIGGHIFIHGGLFDSLETENALAFVLEHEIGHVVARHPISSLGRGIVVAVALTAILGLSDSVLPDWLLSNTTNVTLMSFSREQESQADLYALEGLSKVYGHVAGASEFFEFIKKTEAGFNLNRAALGMEILQTHPLNESRLERIDDFMAQAKERHFEALIPLPDEVIRADSEL